MWNAYAFSAQSVNSSVDTSMTHQHTQNACRNRSARIGYDLCAVEVKTEFLWADFTSTVQLLLTNIIYVSRRKHKVMCLKMPISNYRKSKLEWWTVGERGYVKWYWIAPGTRWHIQKVEWIGNYMPSILANLTINHTYASTQTHKATNPLYLHD